MDIAERIQHIQQLIHQEEISCHRQQGAVKLIAVSKGQPSDSIEQAFSAGLRDFAENYMQEAKTKMQALATLPLCWHYIGPIQSNKTKSIARHFSWVHSVSRESIAQQLNDARPASMTPLNICLQVNLDNEETKSGVSPDEAQALASYVLQLPHLHLHGLMAIPKQQSNEHLDYLSFLRLTTLLHTINQKLNINMTTLSMGMSHDLQAAIRAGSTMVRVGTAIFGERRGSLHEN